MWDWSASDLSSISTVRVRRKEIHTTHFTADDLENFYGQLARINFTIRCPGGIEDLARQRVESGGYMSRWFVGMMTGNSLADDWLFRSPQSASRESEEPDATSARAEVRWRLLYCGLGVASCQKHNIRP